MEDTWTSRDLPVLEATIRLVDQNAGRLTHGGQLAGTAGLADLDILAALHALSPDYVRLRSHQDLGGGLRSLIVDGATADGRRAAGQWPTGQGLIEQLVAGIAAAADREPEPVRRSKLREIAAGLGGAAKGIAIDVATKMIEGHIPGAH